MNWIKQIFILLLLQLMPLSSLATQKHSDEAKLVYLSHLHLMNKLYLDANLDFLQTLRSCLYLKAGDKTLESSQLQIIQKYLNLDGDETQSSEVCDQFVERWMLTLSREFKTLRKSLILSSASARADNLLTSHTVDAEIQYKLNLSPRHKNMLTLSGLLQIAELEDASEPEALRYAALLDKMSLEKCQEFSALRNLKLRFPGIEACDYLIYKDWSDKPDLGIAQLSELKILRKDFLISLFYHQEAFRKEQQEEYEATINLNPTLLYLSSSQPTWKDLITAVEYTILNHNSFVEGKNLSSIQQVRLAFSLSDAENLNPSQIQNSLIQLEEVLRKQRLDTDLSEYLKKVEPSYDFASLIAETERKWAKQEGRREMMIAAVGIGANLGCLIPTGKLLAAAAKTLLKTSCLFAVGIGFNTFFVLHSRAHLKADLEQLLMSTTARYARGKMDQVDERRIALLAASLFWPIAIAPR